MPVNLYTNVQFSFLVFLAFYILSWVTGRTLEPIPALYGQKANHTPE